MSRTSILSGIPNVKKNPLNYVFEDLKFRQESSTLWLEFGVYSGGTINYLSQFTDEKVYGFDSFEGLPEDWRKRHPKGEFDRDGKLPDVFANVELIKGWFDRTLPEFLAQHPDKKVSFVHIDCDLYSSTKCVFDLLKDRFADSVVVVFDELVNFAEFDGDGSELRALHEFLQENPTFALEWIGMNGEPFGMQGKEYQSAAAYFKRV